MKKTLAVFSVLLMALLLVACSGSDTEKKESVSEKIDRQTTRMADKIVKKIRSPLQKARDIKKSGDKHLNDIDRALGGQ